MDLQLSRSYFPNGTNGQIQYNGSFQCFTIELPWLDNRPQRSCIPEGRYQLVSRYSRKYGSHYMLQDVPGRLFILIHPANDAMLELKGCIAPVTKLTGEGKGIASRMATEGLFKLVERLSRNGPVFLTIKTK